MSNLQLQYRPPEIGDEQLLHAYVQEHYQAGEHSISAGLELTSKDYQTWVEDIRRNAVVPNGEWGRSSLLLCFSAGVLIGLLSIRYELGEALRWKYGDVGYGVRPTQRQKGFACEMLRHALTVCRGYGMGEIIIGCFADNTPSVQTILKNGGKLVRECDAYQKGTLSRYYRIVLLAKPLEGGG